MKTRNKILLGGAHLLALFLPAPVLAAGAAEATPPGFSYMEGDFRLAPMAGAKQQQLREALRACAAVELELHQNGPKGSLLWSRRMTRGEELDAILARLAAVPQWYEGHCRIQARIPTGHQAHIRFVDAAGKSLLELRAVSGTGHDWGTLYLAQTEKGPARNLVDYFPLPPRPWGDSVAPGRVSFIATDDAELRRIDPAYDQRDPLPGEEGFSLCRLSPELLVLARHGGSGLYVTAMRVYLRPAGEGGWTLHPAPLGHSTGSPAGCPASCAVQDGTLSIYDREGRALLQLKLTQTPTIPQS